MLTKDVRHSSFDEASSLCGNMGGGCLVFIYNKETNLRDDKHTTNHQTKKNFFPPTLFIAFAVVASWLCGHTSSFLAHTS